MKPWNDLSTAANGEPIKENFRKWFGKSKVVDQNGDPLVVYHGTDQDFDSFETSRHGAFFCSATGAASAYALGPDDDETVARSGANVVAAYLSLQNPLVVTDEWLSDFEQRASADPFSRGHKFRDDFVDSEIYARDAVVAEAKRLGHDGLILPFDMLPLESMNGDWEEQPAYAAFYPHQIKSSIGNSGLYLKDSESMCDEAVQLKPKRSGPSL